MNIQKMPVIQSCPFQRLVRNVKAQGTDQMERAAGGGAGTGNISAVAGDLRLDQNDMQHSLHLLKDLPDLLAALLYGKLLIKSIKKLRKTQLFLQYT